MDDLSENLEAVGASSELTEIQRAELDRRLAEADANPESLISLEEVTRRLSEYT
ncbi:MAG TPA: addiction module protein [Phycisphaerae bacterium]|nr:addiction module protein [Phycisphaerae bacterium]